MSGSGNKFLSPKGLLIILFLWFSAYLSFSQTPLLDSLKLVLKVTSPDTAKCRVLDHLVENEYDDNVWPNYNKQIEEICIKNLNNPKLDTSSVRKFKIFLGSSYSNSGYITKLHGDIHTALDYYYKGLKILEEIGNKKGVAETYNNIAFIYKSQDEPQKALDYFNKSLKVFTELGDKLLIAHGNNNIGFIYHYMGGKEKEDEKRKDLYSKSLHYYDISLKLNTELGNLRGVGFCQHNIAFTYLDLGDTTAALDHFYKSLELRRDLKDKQGIAQTTNSISMILAKRGDTREALKLAEEGFKLAKEVGLAKELENSSKALSAIYAKAGEWRKAYDMQILYQKMSDSLSNESNQKEMFQKGFQFEYEKKAAADSVRVMEEKKVIAAELKQERTQKLALYGGLALVLVFAGFIYNRFRLSQKQKRIIEMQKHRVELQKEEIQLQKELVDEKQKEIIDSINYAKRLQNAILPPERMISNYLKSNFVLFQPKDIVAGDFYWMHVSGDWIFMAAADSTGHGVPGAMVSIVCSGALDKAVKEFGLIAPGKILDKARELILETFSKSGEEIKDGMDISLIAISFKTKEIKWSGANNPLWYIDPDDQEVKEMKADKQPVGKSDHGGDFTTHELEWKDGSVFYLLTDGYPDQFGGPKGKKFKYQQLKEKLLETAHKSMQEQGNELEKIFASWKGSLEQVDDVTIIGIKI